MTQFYILEIQLHDNGEYGHLVHYAYDEDPIKAQRKAEAKYYEILAACALSELPMHSVTLLSAEGGLHMSGCYKNEET